MTIVLVTVSVWASVPSFLPVHLDGVEIEMVSYLQVFRVLVKYVGLKNPLASVSTPFLSSCICLSLEDALLCPLFLALASALS